MSLFDQLNLRQKEAVTSTNNIIRVIAGAGSGKTRVLTLRIAYLVEQLHFKPSHILAITFTNKAAKEMKNRLTKILKNTSDKCHISTIHSLCVRILVEDIKALNYKKGFIICDSNDQKQVLKGIYKELNFSNETYPYNQVLNYISKQKNDDIDPPTALIEAKWDNDLKDKARIYQQYTKELKKNNALDFDDLILTTLKIFKNNQDIATKWAKRFDSVLVDEFQDIDKQQYRLIKYLTNVNKHLFVVGDPDQTIYTWRGAKVNIIMNFNQDFPTAKTIILDQNYRSSASILNAANSLIKHNDNRFKKDLFSVNISGEPLIYKNLESEREESYFVIREVAKYLQKGIALNDIAILYRANYLSRNIESRLRENRIPYTIYGGLRFYDRSEIKDMLCYLRLLESGDDLALLRIINTPRRGIGEATIQCIKEVAKETNLSLYNAIKDNSFGKSDKKLKDFVEKIENWRKLMSSLPLFELLGKIAEESGYFRMLADNKEEEKIDNIRSLQDEIREFTIDNPEASLNDYLQQVSLYTDLDEKEKNTNQELILSTIHAAKGLEFSVVFVIGLAEHIFPSDKSLQEEKGIEEERRLAYVAFTRAKKALILTSNSEFSYVSKSHKTPSRFIKEIDSQYINDLTSPKQEKSIFNATTYSINKPKTTNSQRGKLKVGDIVYHSTFQKGIVTKINNNIATIAFAFPFGIKNIMADHPALKRE